MTTNRTALKLGSPILLALVFSACIGVRIERNAAYSEAAFARAEDRIEALESSLQARKGSAQRLHLMVYDGDERELIQVSVPLWIVDACMDLAEGSDSEDRVHRLEDRYDVEWKAIKDLGRFGPGLLASIIDERSRILIWLQ
jgi:hypothetical protein